MKRAAKILIPVICIVLALGLTGAGFSRWASGTSLTGDVAADGKWDVKVTDAALELSDSGAAIGDISVSATAKVTVYDVTVHYVPSTGYYVYNINVDSAREITLHSEEEYREYGSLGAGKAAVFYTYGGEMTRYSTLKEGTWSAKLIEGTTRAGKAEDGGASDAQVVGQGFVWNEPSSPVYPLAYTKTADVLAALRAGTTTVSGETVITESGVTYAPVNFSLPGAWSNYKVTIRNNGTSNANLSDYSFDFTKLDDTVYDVKVPVIPDDAVLAPGKAMTFNFVVQIKDAEEFHAEATAFEVTLNFEQDTVNAAPEAGITIED